MEYDNKPADFVFSVHLTGEKKGCKIGYIGYKVDYSLFKFEEKNAHKTCWK